jgi:hypothetical protein
MGDGAWAGVLMVGVAVVILAAFTTLWLRDKGRADEVVRDPQRTAPDPVVETRPRDAREGAADEPPALRRERRH